MDPIMDRTSRALPLVGFTPYHGKKDGDEAKNGLGWCDARELLGKIQTIDNHIHRGENTISSL